MFFLTEQDPNFRIKGSRDPLGFQPLWQALGRNVVRYLSTVSVNIKDFQILSYAWYIYGDRDPKNFLPFFFRLEQAYGFARGEYIKGDAFNGIDFVRKHLTNRTFTFSNKSKHTLLSNQKSYGIFGKYNRPFTEMRLKEQSEFKEVMESSIREKVNFDLWQSKAMLLLTEDEVSMDINDIKIFADSINSLTQSEREFYKTHLLKTDGLHVQNELFDLLEQHDELCKLEQFNLFGFVQSLQKLTITEELKALIVEIEQSERVLVPYIFLFKTLQSEPLWKQKNTEELSIFKSFPKKIQYQFKSEIIDLLNDSLDKGPHIIALEAVKRNNDISKTRGNAPWIKLENNELVTCYADGRRYYKEIKVGQDFEHNYFLPSYISMYQQIMK